MNAKTKPMYSMFLLLAGAILLLMLYYYAPDKTEQGLMQQLGFKSTWQLKEYHIAARNYTARKTMNIIAKIRETDAKAKGVEAGSTEPGDTMTELIFFILH